MTGATRTISVASSKDLMTAQKKRVLKEVTMDTSVGKYKKRRKPFLA
jgi:hypothetical protein